MADIWLTLCILTSLLLYNSHGTNICTYVQYIYDVYKIVTYVHAYVSTYICKYSEYHIRLYEECTVLACLSPAVNELNHVLCSLWQIGCLSCGSAVLR